MQAADVDQGKQLATTQARAALAGVSLVASTDDRDRPVYIASQWAWTREFKSLDEVNAWLDRVTGASR